MDRETSDYETPKEVVEKVFDSSSAILLIKRDDYYPDPAQDNKYPADFDNKHKKTLNKFFENKGLKETDNKELLYVYRDTKSPSILYGSVVSAGTNPTDISPYITLQSLSLGYNSPIYILKPHQTILSGEKSYDLSVDGDPKTTEFTGTLLNAQIYKMINGIYLSVASGMAKFPKSEEDPFLSLAKDLSKVNYRDFSKY